MNKKIKIVIATIILTAVGTLFAQQVYTYWCMQCKSVKQTTSHLAPTCCGFSMMSK